MIICSSVQCIRWDKTRSLKTTILLRCHVFKEKVSQKWLFLTHYSHSFSATTTYSDERLIGWALLDNFYNLVCIWFEIVRSIWGRSIVGWFRNSIGIAIHYPCTKIWPKIWFEYDSNWFFSAAKTDFFKVQWISINFDKIRKVRLCSWTSRFQYC
jgi:hypothetical protein